MDFEKDFSAKFICMESETYFSMIKDIVAKLKAEEQVVKESKWISPDEASKMLSNASKATMQRLRDSGQISITQPSQKRILYDRKSILEYLEKNKRTRFKL